MSVKYQYTPHLISQQYEAEQQFLQQFHSGVYTLENPLIVKNPYLIAPLTALIMFQLSQAQSASICVHGKNSAADMTFDFPATTEHIIPVYGLYAGYDNQVTITLADGTSQTYTISTDPAPENLTKPEYTKTTAEYFGQNVMFLSPASLAQMKAFDLNGDLRWYSNINIVFDVKRLKNGHLLVATERLITLPYVVTGVYELSMSGKIYKEFRLPGGTHHDYIELDDGNLIILTQDLSRDTVEDMAVLVDRESGEVLRTWDLLDVIPKDAGTCPRSSERDWAHNNSICYDKRTDSLTFSLRNHDAIANVDFSSGKLNWLLGDTNNWPQDYVQKYFFTADTTADFDWFYAQHACTMLPDGDILLFDNGAWRSKFAEQDIPVEEKFTRAVRYRLDHEKKTVRQVWQYGKERGVEFFAPHISNTICYGENHYLVHSGDIGQLRGKPCNRPPIFYLNTPDEKDLVYYAITTEIKDGQVCFEMKTPGAYYRATKMCLYDQNDVLTFGRGKSVGSLGKTSEIKARLPEKTQPLPEQYALAISDEADRFELNLTLPEGTYALLVLSGENGDIHKYQLTTTEKDESTMCVALFQTEMNYDVYQMISKEGLNGQYAVKLLIEDLLCETDITITA